MAIREKLRAGLLATTMAVALLPFAAATPAAAQAGDDIVEACAPLADVPELGIRFCGGVERGLWLAAQHCRRVSGLESSACPSIDGRQIDEAAMQAFEEGWVATALDLQRDLDLDVPLTDSLILHTHNSANSTAYDPSFTTNDPNQVVTITDQLRLGIRGIEIDVHWAPQPSGDPAQGFRTPVQCHGEAVPTPAGTIHGGCSVDQPLPDLLDELRAWLDRPENADEFVLLYLENALDDDPVAHDAAAEAIEASLGDLVHRPQAGGGCQDLPIDRSKNQLTADGARVLITGNCGPGAWTDLVFQRGPAWNESGGTTDYLSGSDCDTERAELDYDNRFIRRWEDSTFLSLMANGGSYISPEVAAALVRCGVNLPGLDQLHPGDDRLPAFVWSWREQEPGADPARACAAQGTDTRFGALDCERSLPVACRTATGEWAVTTAAVPWADGDLACIAEGHASAGVPANGWDNQLLRRAAPASATDVWLGYGRDADGRWVTDIPEPAPEPPAEEKPGKGPKKDHPGKGPKGDPPGKPDHAKGPKAKKGSELAATTVEGDDVSHTRDLPSGAAAAGMLAVLAVTAFWRRRPTPNRL